jgi:exopolyphosphatase/guanosine-5'-triphosphate,3'-diphosphate pyrophosphatase
MDRVAAVDCGTNSTRLLIVNGDGSTRLRLMRITRLGEGVDATGMLAGEAVERTISVLSEYRHHIDDAAVTAARLVATSAVRDAANGEDFLRAASVAIGTPAELLDGHAEGELAYAGATSSLPPVPGDDVVIDIGGGSTEIALGRGGTVYATSVDIGCVRVTERFFRHDPPTADEVREAESSIRPVIKTAACEVAGPDALSPDGRLIGLAGTVTTLAALELGLEEYDHEQIHHSHLTRDSVDHWCRVLGAETASERSMRPAITPGREDVIVGGALILRIIMDVLGFETCLVSEADMLDGLAMSLL